MDLINDPLRKKAVDLEKEFYASKNLDVQEWQALADEFDQAGRPAGAVDVRRRLLVFSAMTTASIQ